MNHQLSVFLTAGCVISLSLTGLPHTPAQAEPAPLSHIQLRSETLHVHDPNTADPSEAPDPTEAPDPAEGTDSSEPDDQHESDTEHKEPEDEEHADGTVEPGENTGVAEPDTEHHSLVHAPDDLSDDDPEVLTLAPESTAPALLAAAPNVSVNFQAGNIISDQNFYAGSSMSKGQIQAFLNRQVPRCTIGDPGKPAGGIYTFPNGYKVRLATHCLKNAKLKTTNRARSQYCKAYKGLPYESAAQIIERVGKACGVSPKVLLVMLQKEQSLITDTFPAQHQMRGAMGYACPDSGPNFSAQCDSMFYGFFNQVYWAARQLKYYKAHPNSFRYKPFQHNTIQWAPNPACGTSQVYIANWATAALYIYTPYRPNQAALNAGWGASSDPCATYGNRNFYNFYAQWFGSPNTRWADVYTNHPFYKHIEWMGARGYAVSGENVPYFKPKSVTTRGAIATFFRRMIQPNYTAPASLKLPYVDVPKTHEHYDGIAWMYERGYAAPAKYYNPGRSVTRAAMATFLYRLQGGSADGVTAHPPYRDVPSHNAHATPIAWMAKKGYAASGRSYPDYHPGSPVTRQALSAFLYRIYK